MREAAQWLIDKGCPLWNVEDLTAEKLSDDLDGYIVMWEGRESVATLLLSYEDSFFWPDVPAGTSGFIHKLSVRRKFAGTGAAKKIVRYAMKECKSNGIQQLRLDCDNRKQLCDFYEGMGFRKKAVKQLGKYSVVFYEYFMA